MHILIGTAVLVALVGIAFGGTAARAFAGLVLALGAAFVLLIVLMTIYPDGAPWVARSDATRPAVVTRPEPAPPLNPAQSEAQDYDHQKEADAAREAWTRACLSQYEDRFGYDYERARCNLVPADYHGYPVWDRLPRPPQSRR